MVSMVSWAVYVLTVSHFEIGTNPSHDSCGVNNYGYRKHIFVPGEEPNYIKPTSLFINLKYFQESLNLT